MANKSRLNIFKKALLSGFGAQIIVVAVSILSVPIGIGYYGPERYGIWLVLLSLAMYLNASQFGIGTAAAALISKAQGPSDQNKIASHSFGLLFLISLFSLVLILIAGRHPRVWLPIFGNISLSLQREALGTVLIFTTLFFFKLPTVAFTSAFIGLQKVYLERLYVIILPSAAGIISLLFAVWIEGNLLTLAMLTGVGNLFVGMISGWHLFISHPELRPRRKDRVVEYEMVKKILHSGKRFFIIALTAIVVWNTDNLVISYFLGPAHVSAYAITFKLFVAALSLIFVVNSSLWPMYGKASVSNDWGWIRGVYENLTKISPVLGGLIWIGGICFARDIIQLWTGAAGYGGLMVVFALGVYGYTPSLNHFHSTLLGVLNLVKGTLWAGIF